MNIIDTKNKLERIDQLIKMKATGTPKELAKKLNTTERNVYRIIKQLKVIGCPIYFDKERKSYCYECSGKLMFEFEMLNPDNATLKNTGGVNLKPS